MGLGQNPMALGARRRLSAIDYRKDTRTAMWIYEKKLQYPVKIKTPNARTAQNATPSENTPATTSAKTRSAA